MFEIVEKVETKDGTLFDTVKEASDYVTDQACADINEIIKETDTYDVKHKDLTAIITALAGTVENIQRLQSILSKHI